MFDYNWEKIKERIQKIAKLYGVNPELAVKVAECESGLFYKAVNRNRNGTIDRGLYQWNDYWHPEVSDRCAFDVACSTIKFCEAVKAGHLDWWNATKPCWRSAYKKSLLTSIRDILIKIVSLLRQLLKKRSVK